MKNHMKFSDRILVFVNSYVDIKEGRELMLFISQLSKKLNFQDFFCFVMQVALVWLLAFTNILLIRGESNDAICKDRFKLDPRPHSVSILEFGAVGDGNYLNTLAFQNAIFYLKSFADKGGAQLYVPPGKWLTGSFNLTSHLTLFLEKGATILASPV